jgi:hypothetical protein
MAGWGWMGIERRKRAFRALKKGARAKDYSA